MAIYTVANGGGNINAGATYVGGIAPSSTDTIDFTATSGQLTVNTPFTIAGINFTNYVNTITMTGTLTVNGNVTLSSGMSISGGGNLSINATATLTSNGKTWTTPLVFLNNTTPTITFADDWTITSTFNVNGGPYVFNGNTLNLGGNVTINQATSGTTNFIYNGTGTWSGAGAIRNNLTINTSGTITISGSIAYNTRTLTYTSGTVTTTGSTLNIAVSTTLNTNGITWNNVSVGTATVTLLSDLTIGGNYSGTNANQTFNGAFTIYLAGDFTQPINCNIAGTAPWVWNGTTNKTFSCVNNYNLSNITINGTGTVTFINTFPIGAITFQILTPCFCEDCNFIISIGAATTTIDTSLVIWKNFTIANSGTATVQLNSILYTRYASLGSGSQQLTINGSFIYIVDGTLTTSPGNGGSILGTSSIYMIGNKATYLDSANPLFNFQGVWRVPIVIDIKGVFLMVGKFVIGTSGTFSILNGTVVNLDGRVNRASLLVGNNTTLINIDKCKFKNVTINQGLTVIMNKFFSGSPENKTVIISNGTNYTITFTDNVPKKAFHVNVQRCTITNRNQLTIVNRNGNGGFNQGILFGESGMSGFPLNTRPVENSYPTEYGFTNTMTQ